MTFLNKLKERQFWNIFLIVFAVYFITVTIISLLLHSFSDIFSSNWSSISETNFNNGKWKSFWVTKLLGSFIFGLYLANKKVEADRKNRY